MRSEVGRSRHECRWVNGVRGKRGVQKCKEVERGTVSDLVTTSVQVRLTEKDELDLYSLDWVLRHGDGG